MIIVACIGYISFNKEGVPFRFKQQDKLGRLFATYPHAPFHNKNCDNRYPKFKEFNACLLSKDAPPEVLIIGDSHSHHYYKSGTVGFYRGSESIDCL